MPRVTLFWSESSSAPVTSDSTGNGPVANLHSCYFTTVFLMALDFPSKCPVLFCSLSLQEALLLWIGTDLFGALALQDPPSEIFSNWIFPEYWSNSMHSWYFLSDLTVSSPQLLSISPYWKPDPKVSQFPSSLSVAAYAVALRHTTISPIITSSLFMVLQQQQFMWFLFLSKGLEFG